MTFPCNHFLTVAATLCFIIPAASAQLAPAGVAPAIGGQPAVIVTMSTPSVATTSARPAAASAEERGTLKRVEQLQRQQVIKDLTDKLVDKSPASQPQSTTALPSTLFPSLVSGPVSMNARRPFGAMPSMDEIDGYAVVSTVSFGGIATADVSRTDEIMTLKVSDQVAGWTVREIAGGRVVVEKLTMIPSIKKGGVPTSEMVAKVLPSAKDRSTVMPVLPGFSLQQAQMSQFPRLPVDSNSIRSLSAIK